MNFVEAAITLLEEAGKPLPVEQLCELALDRGLLDRPGSAPLRSMKGRLTTELHRGDDSRLIKLEGDLWALREGARAEPTPFEGRPLDEGELADEEQEQELTDREMEQEAEAFEQAPFRDDAFDEEAFGDELPEEDEDEGEEGEGERAEPDENEEEDEEGELGEPDEDEGEDGELADDVAAETDMFEDTSYDDDVEPIAQVPGETAAAPTEAAVPSDGRRRRRRRRRRRPRDREGVERDVEVSRELSADQAAERAELQPEPAEEEVDDGLEEIQHAPQTPEEEEFARMYGDELDGTTPVGQVAEYRDQRTADEDRPLLPEIKADRRGHLRSRREDRRSRRDRERAMRADRRDQQQPQRPGPAAAGAVQPSAGERRERAEEAPASRRLADIAYAALASLQDGQAVNVNQLAQMMRKRNMLSGDPNLVAPLIKAALLGDASARIEHGLRPRVDYRGRGTFAARASVLDEATRRAEAGFADAITRLESATRSALKNRLSRLGQGGLERLVHLYLERSGWHDVEWIKRVGPSSYAIGRPPFRDEVWLIGLRTAGELVDRRGVGELRAGVEAKALSTGMLLSSHELAPEARAELSREGKPISVVCGEDFVTALLRTGVGVVPATARVHYLDCELLDELS